MFKKAIDISGLSIKTKKYLNENDSVSSLEEKGIFGDKLYEPVPAYIASPCETVFQGENNSWVVLGRDRPSSRMSGYGGKGDTQCGSIDLVAGRASWMASQVDSEDEQVWVDPNFKIDAARINISQKTDVDDNFKIVDGFVGNAKSKSAIGIKADNVRIVAREGIKLVTGTDTKNSQGANLYSILGIDLIAGNDDTDLQPMVKGNNLIKALEKIVFNVDKLNGIVDSFLMTQMKFNEALTHHYHYSPFFALPTTPAIDVVVPTGIKTMVEQLIKVKRGLINHKINLAGFKINYLSSAGVEYINSRWNNVN